jgi:hypothetical protein
VLAQNGTAADHPLPCPQKQNASLDVWLNVISQPSETDSTLLILRNKTFLLTSGRPNPSNQAIFSTNNVLYYII